MSSVSQDKASSISTKGKIKLAAARVFTRKGFSATKTRDIAEEAGTNIALLHYHFGSKDDLYRIVLEEALQKFSSIFTEVYDTDHPLKEKIYSSVVSYIDLFRENPFLPGFVMSESERDPAAFAKVADFKTSNARLQKQLDELIEAGTIRPISAYGYVSCLIGMLIFPFLSRRTFLYSIEQMDEGGFNAFLEKQKKIIPAIMIEYLYH